jgi:glycosyltransferase involved in cell wall biosynthesis
MPGIRKIKLLLMCSSLKVGGAEMQAALLTAHLNKDIFDIHVAYFTHGAGRPLEIIEAADIPVRFLGTPKWSKSAFIWDALKYIREQRFDIVHAWDSSANFYGRLAAILSGVPVIIGGLQGVVEFQGKWSWLYSLTNLRCSGWIVNSTFLEQEMRKTIRLMKDKPVYIVPNGIVTEKPKSNPQSTDFYRTLKGSRPIVAIIARLHPIKNHFMFVEMAKTLLSLGVEADFWIIGEGSMRKQIEEQIDRDDLSHCIKLLGLRHDVDQALKHIDVVVLTSKSESCPNALLEAMSAGIPVVSTRCTDLSAVILEGKNGYVVDVDDVQALSGRVKELISDPTLRKEMGEHGSALVESKFGIGKAVNILENIYLEFSQGESFGAKTRGTTT